MQSPECILRRLTFNLLIRIPAARIVRPASAPRAEIPAPPYFAPSLDTCRTSNAGALLVVGLVVEASVASRAAVAAASVRAITPYTAVVVAVGLAVAGAAIAVGVAVGP